MLRQMPRNPINGSTEPFDRLFDSVFTNFSNTGLPFRVEAAQRTTPPMNIWQDDQAVHVEMELPGYRMEDIDVTVLSNRLTISGRREWQQPEGATVIRRERSSGSFSRTMNVSFEIDQDRVQAELRDGVLHVTINKPQTVQPRKIEVRAGSTQA